VYLENETFPFLVDTDILSYNEKEFTFTLTDAAAKKITVDFNKKFSLRVGGKDVYNGIFWPLFLSSLPNGIYYASFQSGTINAGFANNKTGKVDNRNDKDLIDALKNSNRLR
jgi:hypothetical protein